jgi:hypothetical protein
VYEPIRPVSPRSKLGKPRDGYSVCCINSYVRSYLRKREEKRMKTIKLGDYWDRPDNFTGIVEDRYDNKYWCLNGKRHRVDGPAIEWSDGDKEWFMNGEQITEEDHAKRTAWTKTTLGKLIFNEHFKLEST